MFILTNFIGFILCGIMLVFIVSFIFFGIALFRNQTDVLDISRKTMIFSFVVFAITVMALQFIFR
ncbi:hypothetical protein [Oribacterium sp. WCC10]|uniref:hypothetical protein n=1 Tax=Oribacterium sp. WCC10 TaxID=1855343 RepID=UPI0008DF2422|nr:hypothetical protein [Oribacterium sp. WCC10]SFG73611.1 hypothetical protein SAMN05216356_12237 [Oribacterium sp. WCC10]